MGKLFGERRGISVRSIAHRRSRSLPDLFSVACSRRDLPLFSVGAGKQMDFDRMIVRANAMIRSYVAGNLVIGALLSAITATVFWQFGLAPAILLGTVSGMLNLIPFLGIVIALVIPLMAGFFNFTA